MVGDIYFYVVVEFVNYVKIVRCVVVIVDGWEVIFVWYRVFGIGIVDFDGFYVFFVVVDCLGSDVDVMGFLVGEFIVRVFILLMELVVIMFFDVVNFVCLVKLYVLIKFIWWISFWKRFICWVVIDIDCDFFDFV